MARRSKIPPMALQISFLLTPEVDSGYIDIAQCLSLMNRKFLRQGQQFYVESWSLQSSSVASVQMTYLSNTWVSTNAWVAALRTWLRSQEQVDNFDEIKGRYHDFKVFRDVAHASAGVADNLIPATYDPALVAGVSASAGASWDASEIQIPNVGGSGNTVGYHLHMIGPDASSKGIIEGYANSRARPQSTDPNTLQGAVSWMESAFDTGENLGEIVTDLTHENDSPPYFVDEDTAFEFYPGGSNAGNGAGFSLDVTPKLALDPAIGTWATKMSGGFIAPLGLLEVIGLVAGDTYLRINIAAGPAKGVMARPMQDVN